MCIGLRMSERMISIFGTGALSKCGNRLNVVKNVSDMTECGTFHIDWSTE